MSAEEAEAETRHQFAVRANSILAFIECDEEQRPKLRKAIIEAMLWAQTQPKLTGVAACRSRSREGRSRHECARDRARSLHGVVGVEFDLQAALAAIEEHAGMAERGFLDRDRHALLLPERAMPPTW